MKLNMRFRRMDLGLYSDLYWAGRISFGLSRHSASPGLICFIFGVLSLAVVALLVSIKIAYKMRLHIEKYFLVLRMYSRNKKRLRKEMERYLERSGSLSMSTTDTDQTFLEDGNDDYATIGSGPPASLTDRSRSPTDPLPDPHDLPGYLKTDFHRYTIFNPNKK